MRSSDWSSDVCSSCLVVGSIKAIAFTIAVIALGAKMAKADGAVNRSEIDAFKEVFRVPPHEIRNVARVFDQARRDSRGFESYAKQVAGMFRENPAVLEEDRKSTRLNSSH